MNRTKEQIVKELKDAGYNGHQVSVRNHPGGLETSLTITIRDPVVKYTAVQEIVRNHQSISRDERTFEILSGGNTYTRLELTDDVKKAWSARYLPLVETAIARLYDDVHGIDIDDRFTIFRDGPRDYKVNDNLGSWLPMRYYRAENVAIDLYLLETALQDNPTKDHLFHFWSGSLWADGAAWRLENGARDRTAMAKDGAIRCKCATEKEDTPKEKLIAEWVADFFVAYPGFQ